jgi:aryl-alcohol dehydrogenase-like predicted oxidoreductase
MNNQTSISKITLGTVQLGIPYGIANKSGQPPTSSSHELLQFALDNGINTLDTARIYGSAEEVIGSFEQSDQFIIITKFKLSDAALDNIDLAICEARESVRDSCETLKITTIPICLFHKNKDQAIEKVSDILPAILKVLKKEGWISEGGISVYSPAELQYIRNWETIRAVQVPMNIFDTRLLTQNLMQILVDNQVKVFIRSIYLQGLILMDENQVPDHLSFAKAPLQRLKKIAASANREIKNIAFSFVRDSPGVTSLVVGAETVGQLKENLALLSGSPLPPEVYSDILNAFKDLPEELITPALWNKNINQ